MLCDFIYSLIKTQRYRVLGIVLDHLMTPDVVNKKDETPLFLVTRNLTSPENRKMARFLIEKGSNFLRRHPITGFAPAVEIVQCEDQDLIDFLLSKLTSMNASLDSVGGTILHYAVRSGNKTTVLKLLNRGANPNQENFAGNTPIHEAVLSKGYDVLQLLVDYGGDINKMGVGGKRPLHMVAYSRFKEIAMDKVLECNPSLEAKDADGNSPLCYFVNNFEDRIKEIVKLLDSGCNPNSTNYKGMNLLHQITKKKSKRTISDNLKNIVNILIQNGLDVDAQTTEDKNSALHLAILNNHDLVATLLSNKASLFLRNSKGQTPFDTAIMELRIGAVLAILPFAILRKISEEDLINVSGESCVARETLMGFVTRDTFERCWKEMEILQSIKLKFYPSISCCDLLYISEGEFAYMLRNANFRRSFHSDFKIFKETRFYRRALKEKFKSAQRFRRVQDVVIRFLYNMNKLPLLCIERIVYFMDPKEILRLQKHVEKSKKLLYERIETTRKMKDRGIKKSIERIL